MFDLTFISSLCRPVQCIRRPTTFVVAKDFEVGDFVVGKNADFSPIRSGARSTRSHTSHYTSLIIVSEGGLITASTCCCHHEPSHEVRSIVQARCSCLLLSCIDSGNALAISRVPALLLHSLRIFLFLSHPHLSSPSSWSSRLLPRKIQLDPRTVTLSLQGGRSL